MTKEEFFKFQEEFYSMCMAITRKKNHDYTSDSGDPFANFKAIETLGISTEQGFLTRMMDKMMRLGTYVSKAELQVSDESVLDTLNDLANYCSLMAGFIKAKNTQNEG
jgi:hypothetical protein